jgi:hypothetical protein
MDIACLEFRPSRRITFSLEVGFVDVVWLESDYVNKYGCPHINCSYFFFLFMRAMVTAGSRWRACWLGHASNQETFSQRAVAMLEATYLCTIHKITRVKLLPWLSAWILEVESSLHSSYFLLPATEECRLRTVTTASCHQMFYRDGICVIVHLHFFLSFLPIKVIYLFFLVPVSLPRLT